LQASSHLLNACTVIFYEASIDLEGSNFDLAQLLSIHILGLCSHTRYREDLLVLLHTLLKFSKQYPEPWSYQYTAPAGVFLAEWT